MDSSDAAEMGLEGPPRLTRRDAIARITLRRPSKLNRLEAGDIDRMRQLLKEVNEDLTIRVLVVTGEGRAFSAGFDLDALHDKTMEADASNAGVTGSGNAFSAMIDELESARVPTICRLNGGVYGGATDLALSCDFRMGTSACELVMPAARLGLHYYSSGLKRWTHRLGPDAAKRFFLLATVIDAVTLARLGVLTDLVDSDALDASVDIVAGQLASRAPQALEGMKRAINEIANGNFDERACDWRNAESLRSADLREGLAAWREKRTPVFRGQ